MNGHEGPDLDRELDRFEQRLPNAASCALRFLRRPGSIYVRVPVAIALVAGGFLSFLPVLGIWMLPLGLVLIAQDLPFVRTPMAQLLAWIERRWPARRQTGAARPE